MPVWIQLTAAVSSALASGLMGIALIPFLEKYRFHHQEPEPESGDTASGNRIRPTMCGLLLIFGCTAGLVLSTALYLQFGGADRTSLDFQTESRSLWLMAGYAFLLGVGGWILDYMTVRKKFLYRIPDTLQMLIVFLISLALLKLLPKNDVLDFGFLQYNAGSLTIFIKAFLLALCWRSMQGMESDTDGISITMNAVQLLFVTILLISAKQNLAALYSLTAAGACLGCFFWNLHPAKCRLGHTGSDWLAGVLPVLCLMNNQIFLLFLYMAVYLINLLPLLFRKKTLLRLLEQETPLQRIALLTGFSAFCGVLSIMLK